ncbi:MAG: FlgO family outer membrane protein [Nitrospirota bacterium]
MMKDLLIKITGLFGVLSGLFFVIPCYAAGNLETAMVDLSTQLSQYVSTPKELTIGVVEFQNLSYKNTNMEKFLCEELTNQLFLTKKFKVIEKSQLYKVIEEQKLSLNQVVDPENAGKIGKILGIDGILIGSIAEKDNSIVINARIVNVAQGEILATANVNIPIDKQILILQGREIPLELQTPGSIVVVSDIEKAEVLLDNVSLGVIVNKELFIHEVLPTKHRVTLKKDGRTFTKEVEVKEDKEERVTMLSGSILLTCEGKLKPITGEVQSSNIEGARVYLQNRKVGKIKNGQIKILSLLPDKYNVSLKKDFHWDVEKTITVSEGETTNVNMILERIGLFNCVEVSFTSIQAEVLPNKEFDRLTGKHTEAVDKVQLIRVYPDNQSGIGFLKMGKDIKWLQFEINKVIPGILTIGNCEVYFSPGLFVGIGLGGMPWVKGSGSEKIPDDAKSSNDNTFWGWQALTGIRVLLSSDFAFIGSIGYTNYSDLNKGWTIVTKDGDEIMDLPPDWRQYQNIKIGGLATKIGFACKF